MISSTILVVDSIQDVTLSRDDQHLVHPLNLVGVASRVGQTQSMGDPALSLVGFTMCFAVFGTAQLSIILALGDGYSA